MSINAFPAVILRYILGLWEFAWSRRKIRHELHELARKTIKLVKISVIRGKKPAARSTNHANSQRAYIQKSDWGACAILLILVVILYVPALGIWAYGDDFGHLARAAVLSSRWHIFSSSNFVFRPLERLINSLNVVLLGYETTLFSHIVSLLGFILSVILVFRIARLLMPRSRIAVAATSAYFAFASGNVMSVTQIDTISQQYATVFSLLLLWWLIGERVRNNLVHRSLLFFLAFLSLCAKESSVGIVCVMPLATHLLTRPQEEKGEQGGRLDRAWLRRLAISYSVVLAALVAYLGLRWAGGATFGNPGDRYSLNFAVVPMLKNVVQLLGSLIYAGSTLDVFPHPQPGRIFVSVVFTLGLVLLGVVGLYRAIRSQDGGEQTSGDEAIQLGPANKMIVAVLSLLILAGMFPVVLTGHMSELYTYSSFPFYALLLGLLVEQGYQAVRSAGFLKPYASRVILVFLLAATVWLAYGTQEKLRLALDISDRAKGYFGQVSQWLDTTTSDHLTLCWRAGQNEEGVYSGFLMPDRVILRGVVAFASQIGSKHVDYVEDHSDAGLCDYEALVGSNGLNIVPNRE